MNLANKILDRATREATAYTTYEQLLAECKGGYVPTLYPDAYDRLAVDVLRLALTESGCQVYPALSMEERS